MKKHTLSIIILSLLLLLIPACSEYNIYKEEINICRVGDVYFDTLQAAVDYLSSQRAISESRIIYLVKNVLRSEYSDKIRKGVTVPSSFEGDLKIDFGGYRYDFSSKEEYFFRFLGGDNIEVVNGISVIYEDSVSKEKALIVGTRTVTIDEHLIKDLRSVKKAVEVTDEGKLLLKNTELSGSWIINGESEIRKGSYTFDSITGSGDLKIYEGTLDVNHDSEAFINNAINSVPEDEKGEISKTLVHELIYHEAVPATCVTTGIKEYWSCSVSTCRKMFLDEECTKELSSYDDLIIPLLSHTLIKEERVESTCSKEGHEEYWYCTTCSFIFRDENGNEKVTLDDLKLPMKSHSLIKHEEVASTCTSLGIYEHWECDVCNKLFKDSEGTILITKADTIKPTIPHSWDEGYQVDKDNHWHLCTVCGTSSDKEKHNRIYGADEKYHWDQCSVCGYVMSEKEAHSFITEGDTKYCTVCGKVIERTDSEPGFDVDPVYPAPTGNITTSYDEELNKWTFKLIGTNTNSVPTNWTWYVDDKLQNDESTNVFEFVPPRPESYVVMCIFWNASGYGSASVTIN